MWANWRAEEVFQITFSDPLFSFIPDHFMIVPSLHILSEKGFSVYSTCQHWDPYTDHKEALVLILQVCVAQWHYCVCIFLFIFLHSNFAPLSPFALEFWTSDTRLILCCIFNKWDLIILLNQIPLSFTFFMFQTLSR